MHGLFAEAGYCRVFFPRQGRAISNQAGVWFGTLRARREFHTTLGGSAHRRCLMSARRGIERLGGIPVDYAARGALCVMVCWGLVPAVLRAYFLIISSRAQCAYTAVLVEKPSLTFAFWKFLLGACRFGSQRCVCSTCRLHLHRCNHERRRGCVLCAFRDMLLAHESRVVLPV
jgi:hypothetical protein